ncbi:MAG: hypothetical protein WCC99_11330 [Candidatus Sulfotelmatobacter sp.]
MSTAVRELRSVVMILVEASWEDESGVLQKIPARMEDRSASGACIRVKTPIAVGAKLTIQWRFDRFCGIAKYCRSDGREFLVGIQRDKSVVLSQPVGTEPPLQESTKGRGPQVAAAKIQPLLERRENKLTEPALATPKAESKPVTPRMSPDTPPVRANREIANLDRLHISRPREFDALRRNDMEREEPRKRRKEASKKRKPMKRKWFELAPWRHKQGVRIVRNDEDSEASGGGNRNGKGRDTSLAVNISASKEKSPVDSREEGGFQVELLPMEEVYRAAGVLTPRRGYSAVKVVDMLQSEHLRGVSTEIKRAAVLVALEAAGVTIGQIQQDAKARREALDSYEKEQQKQAEAEWARRAEENGQIEAELERVKAQYMAKITRNLDGVTREKAAFDSWQTLKKQAAESMAEAVELCLMPANSEAASAPLAKAAALGAGSTASVNSSPNKS